MKQLTILEKRHAVEALGSVKLCQNQPRGLVLDGRGLRIERIWHLAALPAALRRTSAMFFSNVLWSSRHSHGTELSTS